MRRPFRQVDVFSPEPFAGNPLAVVHDAEGLRSDEMQRFARWTNLSETAYLLPPADPAADYRVRIFTLARELPFAGHPTLGSCHAWLEAGGTPRRPDLVIQECPAGLVPIRRSRGPGGPGGDGRSDGEDRPGDDGRAAPALAFRAPPIVRSGPVDEGDLAQVAAVLGIGRGEIVDAQWVDNGPGWLAVLLADAEAVLALEPDFGRHPGGGTPEIGVVGFHRAGSECAYEVRAVLADERGGMIEDPVTGSLNASLAQWLLAAGRVRAPYVASQGTRLARKGRVRIEQDADGTVWVGGATVTRVRGEVQL